MWKVKHGSTLLAQAINISKSVQTTQLSGVFSKKVLKANCPLSAQHQIRTREL